MKDSMWTHALCPECWAKQNPDREAVRMKEAPVEHCCRCGKETADGIYIRADITTMPCCEYKLKGDEDAPHA